VKLGLATTAVGADTISPPTMTGIVVVVVVVVVELGGASQVTVSVTVGDVCAVHVAKAFTVTDWPAKPLVSAEMSAVAVPEPMNPGGVSVVGSVWNAPPFTLTCHTIGWSAFTNWTKDPETSVHVMLVPVRSFADAEPMIRNAVASATASTHASVKILDMPAFPQVTMSCHEPAPTGTRVRDRPARARSPHSHFAEDGRRGGAPSGPVRSAFVRLERGGSITRDRSAWWIRARRAPAVPTRPRSARALRGTASRRLPRVNLAEGLPATPDEIDAAWLTRAMAPRHPGIRVATVEVTEVHEVTNTHVRLRAGYDEPAGAPERLFCKMPPLDPARRELIGRTGMGPREARFYAELAPALAFRVPHVSVALHDARDNSFVLVMEDLEARGCTVSDGTVGVAPDSAARALEELADLHRRFEDASARDAVPWIPATRPDSSYGAALLQQALDHHRERMSDDFAALAELYVTSSDALQDLWRRGPVTIVHGDPHIGNLFDDHGRTGFLDWGIVRVGAAMRDVGYFLTMAMSIEDRRAHE